MAIFRGRRILLFVCCFGVFACHAQLSVQVHPPTTPLQALAIDEVQITYRALPFEAAKRTQDIVTFLWNNTSWEVLAPNEFQILDPKKKDLRYGTDLLLKSEQWGWDIQRIALLRLHIAIHEAKGEALAEVAGSTATGQVYDGTAILRLELVDAIGQTIAEIERKQELDPFAEHPDADPLAEIRVAVFEILRDLISRCTDCFAKSSRPPFAVTVSPSILLNQVGRDGVVCRNLLSLGNILERDQAIWTHMQYFDGNLSLGDAQRWFKEAPAICFSDDPPNHFRPGDCITEIDGVPITSYFGLWRQLRNGTGYTLKVVDSTFQKRTAHWP